MNKAFEKILERLILESSSCKVYKLIKPNIEDVAEFNAYKKCIEIVQEVAEEYNNGWIPCSDRLPEERDWYLAVFEEADTGFIGLPYIADYLMGKHTIATTEDGWIIHNCTDREDESAEYYKKLRCVAWQPLPEPFKERD